MWKKVQLCIHYLRAYDGSICISNVQVAHSRSQHKLNYNNIKHLYVEPFNINSLHKNLLAAFNSINHIPENHLKYIL